MKILIDIGHPAHVHYFKNFYVEMTERGHKILVIARDKEVSHALLHAYQIPFTDRGKGSNSMFGKMLYLLKGNSIMLREAITFKPDLFLSFSSPYAAQVSSLLGKPHIAFDDTEHALLGRMLYRPFTDIVLSPSSYNGQIIKKQQLFNGYMELCYLHPNQYQPGDEVLKYAEVKKDEPFILLRFVSWKATHDAGHSGLSLENKRNAVSNFSKYGKVLISSEVALPPDLEAYSVQIPPHLMHDLLSHAMLFFGESGTMSSEAAMLGTPSIFLNNARLGYLQNLEKEYGLVFNFSESLSDQKKAIQKGLQILTTPDSKEIFAKKRDKMLSDKIDVTQYLISFVEEFMQLKIT